MQASTSRVYTMSHVYAYLMIIIGTGVLALHARFMKGRPWYHYLLSIAGIGLIIAIFLVFILPAIYNILIASLFAFFGQQAVTLTVEEARPWDAGLAWNTFQYGLVLMVLGMAAIIYRNWREEHPDQIYVLVWSLIILFSTIQHVRYEYYVAVNVAILSAFAAGTAMEFGWPGVRNLVFRRVAPVEEPDKKTRQKEERQARKAKHGGKEKKATKVSASPWVLALVGVVALALLFTYFSLQYDILYSQGTIMNGDWKESLEWMANHTPDPGVNYYGIFDQSSFSYPAGSYGVMSWWDYGHQITFIAKRIPNANPFQSGVAGPTGAAAFFMTQSEDYATTSPIRWARGTWSPISRWTAPSSGRWRPGSTAR